MSKPTTIRAKWLKRVIEVSFAMLMFIALSVFLARNMLPTAQVAPDLRLPRLHSGQLALPEVTPIPRTVQWESADRTLLYFFAPWCTFCRVSMPGLSLLDEHDARIIAIALDWETADEVTQFVDDIDYRGEVLLGTLATRNSYKIDAYPSYYVVDENGEILHRDRGLSTPPGIWFRLNY